MDRKPVCLSQLARSGGQNGLHSGKGFRLKYVTDITGAFSFGKLERDSRYFVDLLHFFFSKRFKKVFCFL
jgi:hypothetical protein